MGVGRVRDPPRQYHVKYWLDLCRMPATPTYLLREREKRVVSTPSSESGRVLPSRSASAVGGRLFRWRTQEAIPGLQSRLTKVVKLFRCRATGRFGNKRGSLKRDNLGQELDVNHPIWHKSGVAGASKPCDWRLNISCEPTRARGRWFNSSSASSKSTPASGSSFRNDGLIVKGWCLRGTVPVSRKRAG